MMCAENLAFTQDSYKTHSQTWFKTRVSIDGTSVIKFLINKIADYNWLTKHNQLILYYWLQFIMKRKRRNRITRKPIKNYDDKTVNKCSNKNREKQLDARDNSINIFQGISTDSSDVDVMPKKKIVLKYTEGDLPSCEEIKKFVKSNSKNNTDIYSNDSDTENNSQDEFLFRKRKRTKTDAKMDLIKQFESLPTRVILRVRKPVGNASNTILKPKYLIEQEDGIDEEIITENISRIKKILEKTKARKKKLTDISKKSSNINNKTVKQDVRSKTSKKGKSKLKEKSTLEITKIVTRNELKKKDSIVKTKSLNKRITDNKKNINGTKKDNERKGLKNVTVERNLRTKTLSTTQIEPQKHDISKASIDLIVGLNQNSRKPRRSNKVDNTIVPPEPRRSKRIKANKDVKENDPTPPKPEPILERFKTSKELEILSPMRLRLRPLKSRTSLRLQ